MVNKFGASGSTDSEFSSSSMVLKKQLGGGPLGLGDPDDRTLRKVELEILIPKKMRDKAKNEKCVPEVNAFGDCCKLTGLSMVLKCRNENSALKSCLSRWYSDEQFNKECREEYLKERSEYRKTGISESAKKKESSTF